MDFRRRQHRNSRMSMFGVVIGHEGARVSQGVLEAAESIGELGRILHGLELRFRVRVIVAHVRATMRSSHRESIQERSDELRGHVGAAIGMHGQSGRNNAMSGDRFRDEFCCDRCIGSPHQSPSDDHATKDIEHDKQRIPFTAARRVGGAAAGVRGETASLLARVPDLGQIHAARYLRQSNDEIESATGGIPKRATGFRSTYVPPRIRIK